MKRGKGYIKIKERGKKGGKGSMKRRTDEDEEQEGVRKERGKEYNGKTLGVCKGSIGLYKASLVNLTPPNLTIHNFVKGDERGMTVEGTKVDR